MAQLVAEFHWGPQCNSYVALEETNVEGPQKRKLFRISGGVPPLPVEGYVSVMEMKGLYY